MNNRAAPIGTIHLLGGAKRQPNLTVSEERGLRARIRAQVKIDVCAILVRPGQSRLRAQRVPLGGTQIVHHDDNAITGVR